MRNQRNTTQTRQISTTVPRHMNPKAVNLAGRSDSKVVKHMTREQEERARKRELALLASSTNEPC